MRDVPVPSQLTAKDSKLSLKYLTLTAQVSILSRTRRGSYAGPSVDLSLSPMKPLRGKARPCIRPITTSTHTRVQAVLNICC